MFMGMKIIGDSGAGETMLPYHHLFLNLTVPRHNLTVVFADGTPVPVDGIGVTMFSPATWFVRALSFGILSMSAYDDAECTTHFYNGKIEIASAVLVGQIRTRINLIKNNSSKRVHFSDDEDHSCQKYVDDL